MKRNTPLLALAAVATLALAACQDGAPTAPRAGATPLAAKGGNGNPGGHDYDASGGTPSDAVIAKLATLSGFVGNLSGDGASNCSDAHLGSSGVKIEDISTSQTIAGYVFTVRSDGTTLSFAPAAGSLPTYAITGVIVKGGPGYDVYSYASGNSATSLTVTRDGDTQGLTSPLNNGGNVPTISHFTVCYAPLTTPPKITKKVRLVDMMAPTMFDPSGVPMADLSNGGTAWITYEIEYRLPAGLAVTLSELVQGLNVNGALCPSAGLGISCVTQGFNSTALRSYTVPGTQTATVSGSGTVYITIDFTDKGAHCDRPFTNVLGVSLDGGRTVTSTVNSDPVILWPPRC